jgi:hypothetical protein
MVTDSLLVPPALVAVQVRVVPVVSVLRVDESQPSWLLMSDSSSVTLQLIPTLLVYQSLSPKVR